MWKWIVLILFLILIAIIVWSMLRSRGGAQQVTPREEEPRQVGPVGTGGIPAQGTEVRPDETTHDVETTQRGRADEPYDQALHEEPVAPAPEAGVPAAEAPVEAPVEAEPEPGAPAEPVEEAPVAEAPVEDRSAAPAPTEDEPTTAPAETSVPEAPETGYGQRYADGSTDVTSDGATDFAEPAVEPVQQPGRGTDTGQTPATGAQDLGDRTAPSVGMGHVERGYGEGETPAAEAAPEAAAEEQVEEPTAHAGSEGMGTTSSGGPGTYRDSVTGTQHEADLGPAGSGQVDLPTATPVTPGAEEAAPVEQPPPIEEAPPARGATRVEQAPSGGGATPVEEAPPEPARYEQPPLVEEPPVEQAPVEQAPVEQAPVEPGPYGPGSAEPDEEGAGPAGWTVKGNAGSMLFHTEDSPSYANRADVWFESEETAKAAGFKHWDRKRR